MIGAILRIGSFIALVTLGTCAEIVPLSAEPALDRVLSGVQVKSSKNCTLLDVEFNLRVQYVSHFPTTGGRELRIMLRPIDTRQAAAEVQTRREAIRSPQLANTIIRSIDFEAGSAAGVVLVVQFGSDVHYQVGQGGDFQSIVVAIAGTSPNSSCRPVFANKGPIGAWSTTITRETSKVADAPSVLARGKGTASEAQVRDAAAAIDEGRAAIKKNDFGKAIATFTKVLKMPETPSSAEAQEFLGLAYQKSGQKDRAAAEYTDYLSRYTSGDGAERVRQRLAGITTANGEAAGTLRNTKVGNGVDDDGTRTWTLSGSVSQFYIRDDSFRTVRDPSLPRVANEELDAHKVHQNELLSSLDAIATWSGGGAKSKIRLSATEEHGFADEGDERFSVAALFFESSIRSWDMEARIGRQTRNTGGVLGRFDGGVLSYSPSEWVRFNAVAGSPVLFRHDTPFEDEKWFYGGSVDFGPFWGGFNASLFAIEQRDRSIVDRRAVGTELRYTDVSKSIFATVDYDIHYSELNAAVITGSWIFADKSTLYGAFDYRKSPYLSTWTALQGQSFVTLYDMLREKTLNEIETLAVDRTASFTLGSVGVSMPINNVFQASADFTVSNLDGTIASGGVAPISGTGNEYFYSAQVIGTNFFEADDLLIAGVRFADLSETNFYVLDLSARFPLIQDLKINPRLRVGYRTGDQSDLVEYSVLPSVLFNYYITRDMSLEFEAGVDWTKTVQNGIEETSTDLFLTVGYRYDFYADGQVPGQARAAPYGVGSAAAR